MHKKLEKIVKKTREDLVKRKKKISEKELRERIREMNWKGEFKKAILKPQIGNVALVAEIKLASPSEGVLGTQDSITQRAENYNSAGVDAISVVTESFFFHGDISMVSRIKYASRLPILMKDFIIDPYQIYEAKSAGADALLLIAKLLSGKELMRFIKLTLDLGIEPIIEINDTNDLKKVAFIHDLIIGVNARDLNTFNVDVDSACSLLSEIPQGIIKIGFSGVKSSEEVEKYRKAGAYGVLVGTSLMKSKNVKEFIERLEL